MSIHQVAKHAQVSIATVSRTINQTGLVSPALAARVWKAVEELNYHPSTQARALVSGRSHMLGLIVSDITNPFFPEIVKGFEDVSTAQGYTVLVGSTNYDPLRMATVVRRMLGHKAEGVAVMTSEIAPDLVAELSRSRVPLVFLDVGTVQEGISNLRVDYGQGIREAVQHLFDLGHVDIGFISGPLTLASARVRRTVFLDCLAAHYQQERETMVVEGDHTVQGGFAATSQLLRARQRPTAVLTSNDLTAFGALRATRHAGLRVPEDVSVVGFDDIQLASFTEPPLTTVRLERSEVAHRAFAALAALEDRQDGKVKLNFGQEYVLGTRLIVRQSTMAPCHARSG